MTLSEFFQKYNTILIHDIPWVMKSLELTFDEFDQQLDELIESGEVEKRNYGNFGLQAWGIPQNFKPTAEQLDRLMEIIEGLEHFTPSSLYTHQFSVLRLNKPQLAVAIEMLYEQERIIRNGERKAGNTTYQTYISATRTSGEEDVFDVLKEHEPCSKNFIAKKSGLSRYRVDQIVDQLLKTGAIKRKSGENYSIVKE